MMYHNKTLWLSFVLDYSATHKGKTEEFFKEEDYRLVVYETQGAHSNNHALTKNFPEVEREWLSYRDKQFTEDKYTLDYPECLDDGKIQQRTIASLDNELKLYLPKHLIINRYSSQLTEEERHTIQEFYLLCEKKIVIKSSDSLGKANIFVNNDSIDDLLIIIEKTVSKYNACVLEEVVMHPHLSEKFPNKNTGSYRRSLIHYNTETDEIDVYEIYKNILDRDQSTDNHNHDKSINLYEKQYHTQANGIKDYIKQMQDRKNKPSLKWRNNIFKKISKSLLDYMKKTSAYHNHTLTQPTYSSKRELAIASLIDGKSIEEYKSIRAALSENNSTQLRPFIDQKNFLSQKDLLLSLKSIGMDLETEDERSDYLLKKLIELNKNLLNSLSCFYNFFSQTDRKKNSLLNTLRFLQSIKESKHSEKYNTRIMHDLFKVIISLALVNRHTFKTSDHSTHSANHLLSILNNDPSYEALRNLINEETTQLSYKDLYLFIDEEEGVLDKEWFKKKLYQKAASFLYPANKVGLAYRTAEILGSHSMLNVLNQHDYEGDYFPIKPLIG